MIGSFWISNHRFMRTVREYDRGLMFLTLPYLGFMVLIPFTSQLMGEYSGDFNVAVLFYVLNMVAMAGMAFFIDSHVLRRGLAKPEYEWDVELTRKSSLFTTLGLHRDGTAGLRFRTVDPAALAGPEVGPVPASPRPCLRASGDRIDHRRPAVESGARRWRRITCGRRPARGS